MTVMPCPRLESYPGFTIHIFFAPFLVVDFYFTILLNYLVKRSYWGSVTPDFM